MTPEKLRYAQYLMADQTRSIPAICRELDGRLHGKISYGGIEPIQV